MRKLLIVEDLPQKANEIKRELKNTFPNLEIEIKTSYHSAIEEIFENNDAYFVILLDISMSTFDINKEENGGIPETIAGKRILERMYLSDIPT